MYKRKLQALDFADPTKFDVEGKSSTRTHSRIDLDRLLKLIGITENLEVEVLSCMQRKTLYFDSASLNYRD